MLSRFRKKNFWLVFTADAFPLYCANHFAYRLRFDGHIPFRELDTFYGSIGWIMALKLGIFFFMSLYRGMWRYTGLTDILNILKANLLAGLFLCRSIAMEKNGYDGKSAWTWKRTGE